MTTITPTQARVNLSSVLRRALKGDNIGIVVGGQVVALRRVEILSRVYAEREYGLTSDQMKVFAKKLHAKPKKPVVLENPKKETSKPSLKIEIDPQLLWQFRTLKRDQHRQIGEVIERFALALTNLTCIAAPDCVL